MVLGVVTVCCELAGITIDGETEMVGLAGAGGITGLAN